MRAPRRTAARSALAVLATLASLALANMAQAQVPRQVGACEADGRIAFLASPMVPARGRPMRIILAAEKEIEGELQLIAPDGSVAARSVTRNGGPPYSWIAEVAAPAAGKWTARLVPAAGVAKASAECGEIQHQITVTAQGGRAGGTKGSVWPVKGSWTRASENLYSAWIEKLFDGPLESDLSWKALHEVLRDRSRNMLHNHLGLGEDQAGVVIRPDCADLPYFLRAYFAFKVGLPFGYAKCTRGGAGNPPRCVEWWNIQKEDPSRLPADAIAGAQGIGAPTQPVAGPSGGLFGLFPKAAPQTQSGRRANAPEKAPRYPPRPPGLAGGFGHYLKYSVAETVHSGSGRTAAADETSDYYPVPLTAETLRPGTVYADPYGHLLVVTKRISQTADRAGLILAVDAQPDGTVARKRFWRGNFLFAQDRALGSPGFKRFRPVVRDRNGGMRRLANAEITRNPSYGDFSLDQSKLGIEAFYDRMDDVMSPAPLDPVRAMKEAIAALDEQVRARVTSVENGRKFQASGKGEASMPDGWAIFETTGAWEDFATPSRDLRLLIAIDVVRTFPDRVTRRPERYAMPEGKSAAEVKADMETTLATELASRKFTYTRSDGSAWTLSVGEVVERRQALEMAYNVNDCVELRWGATEGGAEAATCRRRAPQFQRAKMAQYRAWFSERRRPARE